MAEDRHMITQRQVNKRDFLVVYPPRHEVTFPPTTTPKTGPVILITAKVIKTADCSYFSSLIM